MTEGSRKGKTITFLVYAVLSALAGAAFSFWTEELTTTGRIWFTFCAFIVGSCIAALKEGPREAGAALLVVACVASVVIYNNYKTPPASKNGSLAESECPYHLAFIGPLTGDLGWRGTGMVRGARLAVDQFNEHHAANCVELLSYDSQALPSRARSVAADLVGDHRTIGIIGPAYSPESEAADPVLNDAGIPLVTPGATFPDLSTKNWRVFHRALGTDDDVPMAAARYIREVLHASRVYVVDDRSDYGARLADGVRSALGGEVVGSEAVAGDGKQTNFSAVVDRVLRSEATVLVYGGYYTNAGRLRRQLSTAGWQGTLVGGDAMRDPRYVTIAGADAAEGTVIVAPDPPISAARGSFTSDFQKAYGTAPTDSSDVAYDIANMFLQGIASGRTTTISMLAWIDRYNGVGTASRYRFTGSGDLVQADTKIWIYTVADGEFTSSTTAPTT